MFAPQAPQHQRDGCETLQDIPGLGSYQGELILSYRGPQILSRGAESKQIRNLATLIYRSKIFKSSWKTLNFSFLLVCLLGYNLICWSEDKL